MEAPPAAAPTSPPSNSDSTPPPSDTIYTPPSVEVSPPSPSPLPFPPPSTSPPTPSSLPPTPSSSPSTPSSDQNPSVPSPTQLPSNPPSGRTPPAPSTPAPSGGAPPPEPSNDASPPVLSGVISPPPPSGRGSHPPPSGRDAHPPPPGKDSHPPPPSGNNVRPPGRGSYPAPPGSISPKSPSGTSRPPPPSSGGGSSSWPTDTVVGVAIGCAAVVVIVSLLCILFKKKKNGRQHPESYMPPPPPPGPKVQPYGEQMQNWQQSMPPPAHNVIIMPPKPSPPSVGFSRPPPPPPPYMSSSGASESNYSGTDTPCPLLSPNMSFGATKSMFTYEKLALATDGFSDARLLGQGGFGYVHKGVFPNGKEVAIKKLKADSGQGDREFQAEVEIISRVHHKHLVSLVGYCVTGMERILVYDFVPNNTLEFHLHARGRPVVDWSMRLKIALGAARGLAYLHEDCHPKIIHRDIKASNILLDFSFEAKVADFGLAKFSSDDHTHVSTRVMGTFGYLAPEYASSGKLTEKSDVFSFGVVLLELITGRRPLITDVTILEDSLVDWARPLLIRALEDGNFDVLVDTRIRNSHNHDEMARMMACAAACVRHSAKRRPRMSQVVRALEGDASLSDLNEGTIPGNSSVFGSYRSSGRDSSQYSEVMKKLRKTAFSSQEYGTTGQYSNPTSEYGLNPSGSSSEDQQTREIRCLHRKGK